jgi:putative pyruvate formate lyase activating enzyme
MGRALSTEEFAALCLRLKARGAENINLVTGSHAAPALAEGLYAARESGLSIPLLWNSSAYESLNSLSILKDLIDVYLPDLKTLDPSLSQRFFQTADYPARAEAAILRMLDYCGELRFNGVGILQSGVIIRHLILPGCGNDTREVIRWFAQHARGRALLSLMTQYTPVRTGASSEEAPSRYISEEEYAAVLSCLDEFAVEDGFLQEPVQDSAWLPDFERPNPFSSKLSLPVWHWKAGWLAGAG